MCHKYVKCQSHLPHFDLTFLVYFGMPSTKTRKFFWVNLQALVLHQGELSLADLKFDQQTEI